MQFSSQTVYTVGNETKVQWNAQSDVRLWSNIIIPSCQYLHLGQSIPSTCSSKAGLPFWQLCCQSDTNACTQHSPACSRSAPSTHIGCQGWASNLQQSAQECRTFNVIQIFISTSQSCMLLLYTLMHYVVTQNWITLIASDIHTCRYHGN